MDDTLAAVKTWSDVPGANLPILNDDLCNDFAWMELIDEDDCYMALDVSDSKSNKSLDFGADGYTGSVSTWHELLQLTCPDPVCGVVFVRGDFPDSPDSFLARAQRRNQKGTFGLGLRIPEGEDYVFEATPAQGFVNLKWPVTRLNFVRDSALLGSVPFASYTACSFVKDKVAYQIARIMPSKLSTTDASVSSRRPATGFKERQVTVDVGGLVRFGCPCSAVHGDGRRTRPGDNIVLPSVPLFRDRYTVVTPPEGERRFVVGCESATHQKRLEIRLWIDREAQELEFHPCKSLRRDNHATGGGHRKLEGGDADAVFPDEVCPFHIRRDLPLREDKPTVIVASFTIVESSEALDNREKDVIEYKTVQEHLGVSDESTNAPHRLWASAIRCMPDVDTFEINAVGRAVEGVMSIASTPVSARGPGGTLEGFGVALIKNIMTPQIVDLESTFWQARLLVKAAQFLHLQPLGMPDTFHVKKETYENMRKEYYSRIVERLRDVCRWLINLSERVSENNRPGSNGGVLCDLHDPETGILVADVFPAPPEKRPCQPRPTCEDAAGETDHDDGLGQGGGLRGARLRGQRFYLAIIIWYIMKQIPDVFEDEAIREHLWSHIRQISRIKNNDNRAHAIASDDPHGCFARWYHSFSVSSICEELRTESLRPEDRQRDQTERFNGVGIGTQSLLKSSGDWQVKAEKSLRLYNQGRFSRTSLGHEAANLAMVGPEIGARDRPLTAQRRPCLEVVKRLVRSTEGTKTLSPGRAMVLRWDPKNKTRSAKPRPAPWELSCLAQHLPVNLGVARTDRERQDCLDACKQFLMTDFTFMSSWDSSKPTTIGHWWDFGTSCIVAAELLNHMMLKCRSSQQAETGSLTDSGGHLTGTAHTAPASRMEKELEASLGKIYDMMKKMNKIEPDYFDWHSRRPMPLYHADTTVQSLEDTPELYRRKQTDKVELQTNIKKFMAINEMPVSDWSLDTIKTSIGASKLHHLSCFDLAITVDCNDLPEISKPIAHGRANTSFWENWTGTDSRSKALVDMLTADKEGLMDLYLIGKPKEHVRFKTWQKEIQNMLTDDKLRRELQDAYQEALFMVLNDSLVDQSTKYRILFAKRLSPATLQAMIFMWHPDAINTFDAHLGDLSQFTDVTNQSITGGEDIWITSITISHWGLQEDVEAMIRRFEDEVDEDDLRLRKSRKAKAAGFGESQGSKKTRAPLRSLFHRVNNTDDGPTATGTTTETTEATNPENTPTSTTSRHSTTITPDTPENTTDSRTKSPKPGKHEKPNKTAIKDDFPPHSIAGSESHDKIHQLSLSLAITGDCRGRSWTCSIVCELFDGKMATDYAQEVAETLQMFIHEQDTARALVFLLLLGHVCEALANQSEKFVTQLEPITGRNAEILFKGMEWNTSDKALRKLKSMLWGLESLRIFRDKLKKALAELDDARKKMILKADETKKIHHKDMLRTAERVKEEFEKRYSHVHNIFNSIQQRIDEGAKLEEGMTSVLSVEQNENISMLTWLTIFYLPPALLVGIFSIQGHGIIPDQADLPMFGWLLGALVAATWLIALSVHYVVESGRSLLYVTRRVYGRANIPRPTVIRREKIAAVLAGVGEFFGRLILRREERTGFVERDLEEMEMDEGVGRGMGGG